MNMNQKIFTEYIIFIQMLPALCIFETQNQCGAQCTCNPPRYICSGNELTYFPKLPSDITYLEMRNSNLTEIGEFDLRNLSFSKVKKLIINGNNIHTLNDKALSILPRLHTLVIENETSLDVETVAKALTSLNKTKLETLKLVLNRWGHIPKDIFESFSNVRLRTLRITGNNLPIISFTLFKYLKECNTLYLSSNKIYQLDIRFMPKLRKLIHRDNRLSKIPKFCAENESLVPFLRSLDLNMNRIWHIKKESLHCLSTLETLKLNGIHLDSRENNVFADLLSLNTLYLNDISSLKQIEEFAFNVSNLKKLAMRNANFKFHKVDRFNPETIFKRCAHLSYLDLHGNHFDDRQNKLRAMIIQVPKLEHLSLSSTGLKGLPVDTFRHLPKLRKLILSNNGIHKLGGNIFNNVTSLKHLYLYGNLIKRINKTSFPKQLLYSFKKIDLSQNPYTCDCDQRWFLNWLKTTNVNVLGYPVYYKCSSPVAMFGMRLDKYHPTEDICNPTNPLHIVAVVLTLFGLATGFIIVVVYNCQTNIKNFIYLRRVRYSRKYLNDLVENSIYYEYDAFVVYSASDELWVHNIFLQKMENDERFRLCIHQRDFDAGETIIRNIDTYLQKCRKVIVIMSNNFAKSEWCQWEIDVVQERRRRQGKDVFLLIMLHNIDSKHMTSELRTLLDSTPHLQYQTGLGETFFWEAAVETLRRPIGHPPIAVL